MKGSLFTCGVTDNWDRVDNDYYATPPNETEKFLNQFDITKYKKYIRTCLW